MSRIEKSLEKAIKLRTVPARERPAPPVPRKRVLPPDAAHPYHEEEEKEAHLRDYLEVLLRRKWVVIVFLSVVITTVTIASLLMTPLYRAKATMHIGGIKADILTFQGISKGGSNLETHLSVMRSQNLARRVITKMPPEYDSPHPAIEALQSTVYPVIDFFSSQEKNDRETAQDEARERVTLGTIMQGLEIAPIKKTKLVNINFISPDPVFAARAANTVADEYINFVRESKLKPTQLGGMRLKKEVDDMRVELEASEERLNAYIAKSQFIFSKKDDDYENLLTSKLLRLAQNLDSATAERISKEAIYREVNKAGVDYSQVLNDPLIRSLTKEYIDLELEYYNLLKIHKPEYPRMIRLQEQIEKVKDRIEIEEQKIINTFQSDYKLALKKEKYLSAAITKLREDVTDFQQDLVEFQTLRRDVETNSEIYNALLQRLKEVEISAALTDSDLQVLDRARVPKAPYKPKMVYNIALSIIFGLFGGVFLAFFAEYFDNSVKTDDDVLKMTRLPVLGKVPITKADPKNLIHNISDESMAFSEAFKSISAYMQYSNASRLPKQILVTSAMSQEGKTLISTGIAMSLLSSQEKGIIIDADLRRPDVHALFDLDNSNGLSSFLSGLSDFDGLIKESRYAGLDVITSGPVPQNPSELLNSSRMRELIDALSATYDYIIIDSAPVLGMSDSLILSTIAESVILVVKANSTPGDALMQTNNALRNVNANTVGVVLNGVSTTSRYNYSSYYCSPYLKKEDTGNKKLL